MKKIKIHGMTADNFGNHHRADTVLTVSDDAADGCITPDRAQGLVSIGSASPADDDQPGKASARSGAAE